MRVLARSCMKVMFLACLLIFSNVLWAQDMPKQADVAEALDVLQASGHFKKEDIEAAKKQLQGMGPSQYQELLNKASLKAQDPTFRANIIKVYQEQQKP